MAKEKAKRIEVEFGEPFELVLKKGKKILAKKLVLIEAVEKIIPSDRNKPIVNRYRIADLDIYSIVDL